jgi:hypothetical protein
VFEVARAKHTLATLYHAYGDRWNQRGGGGGGSGVGGASSGGPPSVLLEEARNLYEQVHISKLFIILYIYTLYRKDIIFAPRGTRRGCIVVLITPPPTVDDRRGKGMNERMIETRVRCLRYTAHCTVSDPHEAIVDPPSGGQIVEPYFNRFSNLVC